MMESNERMDIVKLFDIKKCLHVCAPMVRYSKLPFRLLVRKYNCHLAYTQMIRCETFLECNAGDCDFVTAPGDRPLIIQFASKDPIEFANATEYAYRNTDGVDLNCGCPVSWVVKNQLGACLLEKPDVVQDMIRQVKNRLYDNKFSVSLKIRIHDDINKTVEFCRRAEYAGASYIAVHGRTKEQHRDGKVNARAIKTIKESLNIPVIGNGDIYHQKDATALQELTGVNGVMCARGLLYNPTLFTGTNQTTAQCIDDWITLTSVYGSSYAFTHEILELMLDSIMSKTEKLMFSSYKNIFSLTEHLEHLKMRRL